MSYTGFVDESGTDPTAGLGSMPTTYMDDPASPPAPPDNSTESTSAPPDPTAGLSSGPAASDDATTNTYGSETKKKSYDDYFADPTANLGSSASSAASSVGSTFSAPTPAPETSTPAPDPTANLAPPTSETYTPPDPTANLSYTPGTNVPSDSLDATGQAASDYYSNPTPDTAGAYKSQLTQQAATQQRDFTQRPGVSAELTDPNSSFGYGAAAFNPETDQAISDEAQQYGALNYGNGTTQTPNGQQLAKVDDGSGYSHWTIPGADDKSNVLYRDDAGVWTAVSRDQAAQLQQQGAKSDQFTSVANADSIAAQAFQATGEQPTLSRTLQAGAMIAAAPLVATALEPLTALSEIGGVNVAKLGAAYLLKGTGETLGQTGVIGQGLDLLSNVPVVGKVADAVASIPIPEVAQNPFAQIEQVAQTYAKGITGASNPAEAIMAASPIGIAGAVMSNAMANSNSADPFAVAKGFFTEDPVRFAEQSGLQQAGIEYLLTSTIALHDPRNGLGNTIDFTDPVGKFHDVFQTALAKTPDDPMAAASQAFDQTNNAIAEFLHTYDLLNPLWFAIETPGLEQLIGDMFGNAGRAVTALPGVGNLASSAGDFFLNLSKKSGAEIAQRGYGDVLATMTGRAQSVPDALSELYGIGMRTRTDGVQIAKQLAQDYVTAYGGTVDGALSMGNRLVAGAETRLAARAGDNPISLEQYIEAITNDLTRRNFSFDELKAAQDSLRLFRATDGPMIEATAALTSAQRDLRAATFKVAGLDLNAIENPNLAQQAISFGADTLRTLFLLPGATALTVKKIVDEAIRSSTQGVFAVRPADLQLVRTGARFLEGRQNSLISNIGRGIENSSTIRQYAERGLPVGRELLRTPASERAAFSPFRVTDKILDSLVSSPTQHVRLNAAYRELATWDAAKPQMARNFAENVIAAFGDLGIDRQRIGQQAYERAMAARSPQDFADLANEFAVQGANFRTQPNVPVSGFAKGSPATASPRVLRDINRTPQGLVGNAQRSGSLDMAAGGGGMGYLSPQQRAIRDNLNAAGGLGDFRTRDLRRAPRSPADEARYARQGGIAQELRQSILDGSIDRKIAAAWNDPAELSRLREGTYFGGGQHTAELRESGMTDLQMRDQLSQLRDTLKARSIELESGGTARIGDQWQYGEAAGQREAPFYRNNPPPADFDPTANLGGGNLLSSGREPRLALPERIAQERAPYSLRPDNQMLANGGGVMLSPEAANARRLAEESRAGTRQYAIEQRQGIIGRPNPDALGTTRPGTLDAYRPTYNPNTGARSELPQYLARPTGADALARGFDNASLVARARAGQFGAEQTAAAQGGIERGNRIIGNFMEQTPAGEFLARGSVNGQQVFFPLLPFSAFHIHTTQFWAEYFMQHPAVPFAIANALNGIDFNETGGVGTPNHGYLSGALELSTAGKLIHWAQEMYQYATDVSQAPGNSVWQKAAKIVGQAAFGGEAFIAPFDPFKSVAQGALASATTPLYTGKRDYQTGQPLIDKRELMKERGAPSFTGSLAQLGNEGVGNLTGHQLPRNVVGAIGNPGQQITNRLASGAINAVNRLGGDANFVGYDTSMNYAYFLGNYAADHGLTPEQVRAAAYNPKTPQDVALGQSLQAQFNRSQDMAGIAKGLPVQYSEEGGAKGIFPLADTPHFLERYSAGQGGRDAGTRVPEIDRATGTIKTDENGAPKYFTETPEQRQYTTARDAMHSGSFGTADYARDFLNTVGYQERNPSAPESEQKSKASDRFMQSVAGNAIDTGTYLNPTDRALLQDYTNAKTAYEGRPIAAGSDLTVKDLINQPGNINDTEGKAIAAQRAGDKELAARLFDEANRLKDAQGQAVKDYYSALDTAGKRDDKRRLDLRRDDALMAPGVADATGRTARDQTASVANDRFQYDVADPATRRALTDYQNLTGDYRKSNPDFVKAESEYFNLTDPQARKEYAAAHPELARGFAATESFKQRIQTDDGVNPDLALLRRDNAFLAGNVPGGVARDQTSAAVKRDRLYFEQFTDSQRQASDQWDAWRNSADGKRYAAIEAEQRAAGPFGSAGEKAWYKEHQAEVAAATNARNAAVRDITAKTGANPIDTANQLGRVQYADFTASNTNPKDIQTYPTGTGSSSARTPRTGSSGGGTSAKEAAFQANQKAGNDFFDFYKTVTDRRDKAAVLSALDRAGVNVLGEKGVTAARYQEALRVAQDALTTQKTRNSAPPPSPGGAQGSPRFLHATAEDIANAVKGIVSGQLADALAGRAVSSTSNLPGGGGNNRASAPPSNQTGLPGGGGSAGVPSGFFRGKDGKLHPSKFAA